MAVLFYTAGFALLTYTFGSLWLEERHLTNRDLFKDIGKNGRR